MYVGEALVCCEKHNIRMQILGLGFWDPADTTAVHFRYRQNADFWCVLGLGCFCIDAIALE